MILTISRFSEVSPDRRKQEYNQLAYKVARSVQQGEYLNLDDAIEFMASRIRVQLCEEDVTEIKRIAARIR